MRVGIDVGISGAIAFLNDDLGFKYVFDMPVMALSGKKQQVNASELGKLFRVWLSPFGDGPLDQATAYVEQVHSMPGQGVSATFNFGTGYGVIQGVLGALQIPMVLVSPAAWKRRAGLTGKPKDASRTLAQQLYPAAPLGRKKDVGRADAILIARFGSE